MRAAAEGIVYKVGSGNTGCDMPVRKSRRLVSVCVALLGMIYVGSYFVLSRQGFRQADAAGFEGFYFCAPNRSAADSINNGLDTLYWPLIRVDVSLGTGREAGKAALERAEVNAVPRPWDGQGASEMGSSPYMYLVPYQPNFQRALDELREREFEQGRYNPVMPYPPELVDDTTPLGPGRRARNDRGRPLRVRRRRHAIDSRHRACRKRSRFRRGPSPDRRGTARALRHDDPHSPTSPRAAADRRHRARRSGLPHGLRRGRLSGRDLLRGLFLRLKQALAGLCLPIHGRLRLTTTGGRQSPALRK